MAHELGLGGYGSDNSDESVPSGQGVPSPEQKPTLSLFHSYSGEQPEAEAADMQHHVANANVTAAPDIQELEEEPAGLKSPTSEDPSAAPSGAGPAAPVDPLQLLPEHLRNPPPGDFSPSVEAKLRGIMATSRAQQRSFIDSLRSNRQYSNPDLLQQLVRSYHLQEAGTAFAHDVWDPASDLHQEDYADALVAALDREQERRKAMRAAAPPGQASIAFEKASAAVAASQGAPDLKLGSSTVGASSSLLQNVAALREQAAKNAAALASAAAGAKAGKRSKWDAA